MSRREIEPEVVERSLTWMLRELQRKPGVIFMGAPVPDDPGAPSNRTRFRHMSDAGYRGPNYPNANGSREQRRLIFNSRTSTVADVESWNNRLAKRRSANLRSKQSRRANR